MRKLLYNRFTKFIIFVLILVSAGGMIYHSVSIAEHFRQYREEKEEAYDVIYPVSEVGEEIQIKLMNYLNRIIETFPNACFYVPDKENELTVKEFTLPEQIDSK